MIISQEVEQHLTTVRDYLRWGVSLMTARGVYFGHGTDNAWDECLALLQAALYWDEPIRGELLDAALLPRERRRIVAFLRLRVGQRMPLPYITGQAWFAGLRFAVDNRAIIPRSPVAELIENGFEPWYTGPPVRRVLDLCAGGGCIGIACAAWMPDSRVDLVDISADALALARENIRSHGLSGRVSVLESDLFSALGTDTAYDIIVSNPPYVDARDLASMPTEYRYEPTLALSSGVDGLTIARQILRDAADYLSPEGLLVLEVGNSGAELERQFPDLPFTWVDLARGGVGVLVVSAAELAAWQPVFSG